MDSKTKSGIENQNIKDFSTNILSKKIFTCTICEKMLSPPIILDEEFGNICQCCFENRLGAKKGIRNTDLELILGELVIPCTFNCATFITHKDLKDHQMTCKFRPLNCLFDDCKWKGVTNKFVKHFTQYHKDEILDSENNIYILNFCLGNNDDVTIKLLNDITRPCIIKIEKFVESDQILYTMYNAKDCEYNNTWNYTIAHYGTICKPVTIQCEVQPIRTIFDNKNKQTQVNISTLKSTIGADALVTLILKSPENDLLLKKIKECLECPVCNNLMRPPIYQCTTGHSFCNGCKPRLHNCPACRASMGNGRNFGLENLTNQVPYECKYNWRDCEEILFLQDLKKHEEICPFQPQQTDQNVQSSGPARSQASSTEIGVEECPRLSPSRERDSRRISDISFLFDKERPNVVVSVTKSKKLWRKTEKFLTMAQTNFSKKLMENGILNCGLCRNLLTPPVYLHNTLGNVCHKCVDLTSTSTKECMQNSCLDFILNELTFPCKFQDEGCREYLSRELLRSHQQKCKFRTMECWLAIKKCTWIGQPKKFEEHFIECHKEHIVDIKNDLFVFNVSINNVLTVKMLRKSGLKSYFFKMTKNNLNMLYTLYTTENFKKCESICISHIGKNAEVVSTVSMTQTLNDTKINFAEVSLAVLSKMTEANKTLYLILKSENNKEFDKKYLENFECPICSNLMRSPIYQCKTGHSFCHLCKPKLRQCPTCRGNISDLRNYSLEALTTKLIYECKNKNFGCEERLTADEIEEHEIICDCHKEPCPLKDDTNCLFKGSPADIAVHFTHSHNGEFFDVRTNTYKNVLILPDVSFTKYLIDAENNIFSLVSKGKNKGLEWNLKVLQKINEDDSFVYEIGFTHPTQNRRKFIRRNLISEKYYFTFDDVEEYSEDQYDLPPTKKLYYYCKINVAKG